MCCISIGNKYQSQLQNFSVKKLNWCFTRSPNSQRKPIVANVNTNAIIGSTTSSASELSDFESKNIFIKREEKQKVIQIQKNCYQSI